MSELDCYTPIGLAGYLWNPQVQSVCQFLLTQPMRGGDPTSLGYLRVFAATNALELVWYALLFVLWGEKSTTRIITATVLLNLATHPFIYLVLPPLAERWDWHYGRYLATAEIFAPAVEAALLILVWRVRPLAAVPGAIIANIASWWIGALLPLSS